MRVFGYVEKRPKATFIGAIVGGVVAMIQEMGGGRGFASFENKMILGGIVVGVDYYVEIFLFLLFLTSEQIKHPGAIRIIVIVIVCCWGI